MMSKYLMKLNTQLTKLSIALMANFGFKAKVITIG